MKQSERMRWRGDRVVEGNGLENRRAGNGTEGSNPSLSAKKKKPILVMDFFFLRGFEASGGSSS